MVNIGPVAVGGGGGRGGSGGRVVVGGGGGFGVLLGRVVVVPRLTKLTIPFLQLTVVVVGGSNQTQSTTVTSKSVRVIKCFIINRVYNIRDEQYIIVACSV